MHVDTSVSDEEQYKKEEIDNFKRVLDIINLDLIIFAAQSVHQVGVLCIIAL